MPKLAHKPDLKFVGFRLPKELYAVLLELAEDDSRSVSSELQALIRKEGIEKKKVKPRTEQSHAS